MKALEVLRRPFLFLWALVRPSRLPRCPRCKVQMDAHNDHKPEKCERRCETCEFADHVSLVGTRSPDTVYYCYHSSKLGLWRAKTNWCRQWAPRKARP